LSFEDAKTVDGIEYDTFQEAAIALDLVTELDECAVCFEQTVNDGASSAELISLFVSMTLEGFPTQAVYANDNYRDHMLRDYLFSHPDSSTPQAINWLLQEFQIRFEKDNRCNRDFGLPTPANTDTELQRHLLLYDKQEQHNELERLDFDFPNNALQQEHFNTIMEAVQNPRPDNRFFFINGAGGTGKSTLCKKLHAAIRALGKIVLVCASTTLAALLFKNAVTAHRLFNYPVVEDEDRDMDDPIQCDIKEDSQRMELFQHTSVIFYDEFPSNHRDVWEAIRRALQGLTNIIFVCSGDFRQILPVIKGRPSAEEVTAATVSSSPYWQEFKFLHLTEIMRLTSLNAQLNGNSSPGQLNWVKKQKEYADAIMAVGEGKEADRALILDIDEKEHTQIVGLPGIKYIIASDEGQRVALDWLYPGGFDPTRISQKTILATTNAAVDKWNEIVQNMNPQNARTLISSDKFCEVDDPSGYLKRNLQEHILNRFNSNGVPPHQLQLKIDDICILLRPINTFDLATNSRVRITGITEYRLTAQTLEESPRTVLIPRMRFKFRLPYGQSYQLLRTQFPLRLAYAMSYNKSQSQTLGQVLLDTTGEPFAHGHLYVALSRVRCFDHIRMYIPEDARHQNPYYDDDDDDMPVVKNIVYKNILLGSSNA
jgi:PIF1-like helicase